MDLKRYFISGSKKRELSSDNLTICLRSRKVRDGSLSLNAWCISESYIEIKIKLNFYFYTSLWCLKRFYERPS